MLQFFICAKTFIELDKTRNMKKEKIASLIMEAFKVQNARLTDCLKPEWFKGISNEKYDSITNYIIQELDSKLNLERERLIEQALDLLMEKDFVTIQLNMEPFGCIRLTESGFDSIYKKI